MTIPSSSLRRGTRTPPAPPPLCGHATLIEQGSPGAPPGNPQVAPKPSCPVTEVSATVTGGQPLPRPDHIDVSIDFRGVPPLAYKLANAMMRTHFGAATLHAMAGPQSLMDIFAYCQKIGLDISTLELNDHRISDFSLLLSRAKNDALNDTKKLASDFLHTGTNQKINPGDHPRRDQLLESARRRVQPLCEDSYPLYVQEQKGQKSEIILPFEFYEIAFMQAYILNCSVLKFASSGVELAYQVWNPELKDMTSIIGITISGTLVFFEKDDTSSSWKTCRIPIPYVQGPRTQPAIFKSDNPPTLKIVKDRDGSNFVKATNLSHELNRDAFVFMGVVANNINILPPTMEAMTRLQTNLMRNLANPDMFRRILLGR